MNRCWFAMMLGLSLLLGGCGGPSYGKAVTVKGKVTLDGKPVENARIIFHAVAGGLPAEVRTQQAEIAADGTYTLQKVYPAEYMVQVQSTAPPDATMATAEPAPSPLNKYGAESELRAKVPSDTNTFDYDLSGS
jgi:hypothetical protein